MYDFLNTFTLKRALKQNAEHMHLKVLKCCASTNTLARQIAIEHPNRTALIVAHQQTAGRGRLGRQFYSPKGAGIYFSLLFPLAHTLLSSISLTCAASVAVMRAIRSTTGLQTEIKWVNDILLDEKKVCGILTEAVTVNDSTALIIGIGINLRPAEFPPELTDIAGSLNQSKLPRSALIAAILSELLPMLNHPQNHDWLEDYREHSCVIGHPLTRIKQGEARFCIAESISEDGGLTVRYTDGSTETLCSGEISIRQA